MDGIVLFAVTLYDLYHRDWLRIAGTATGLAFGLLAFAAKYLSIIGAVGLPDFVLYAAPISLAVAYALRRRWIFFFAAFLLCAGPTLLILTGRMLPPAMITSVPEIFFLFFQLGVFVLPLVSGLAGRELSVSIADFRTKQQPA